MKSTDSHPLLLMWFVILVPVGCLIGQKSAEAEWSLINEKDNIYVYTRLLEDETLKEVRIQFRVQAPMQVFLNTLDHVPTYTSWVYKCAESKLVRKINDFEFYYYVRTDFPFPFVDRDIIIHTTGRIDSNTGIYYARSVGAPTELAVRPDCVRLREFESSWTVRPLQNGYLAATYQVRTEAGGAIPDWLTNLAVSTGPMRTIQGLLAQVARAVERSHQPDNNP
jgi:hypothetical protein